MGRDDDPTGVQPRETIDSYPLEGEWDGRVWTYSFRGSRSLPAFSVRGARRYKTLVRALRRLADEIDRNLADKEEGEFIWDSER